MATKVKSVCRYCMAYCPVDVTVEGNRVISVEGNPEAPLYGGFICPKGRALAEAHNDPSRLLHHLKRQPDGSYAPISSEDLVGEIAERLTKILAEHGPRAVAMYAGNPILEQQAMGGITTAFLSAIGSDNYFSAGTIDQPGITMASVLHGGWRGGAMRPEKWDVFLLIGGNPIISKQYFGQNPGQQIKRMVRRGTKLIVIDPRRTETARRAHVHLQGLPGEDPTILAGLIHLVIRDGAVNRDFVDLNAEGFAELAEAVRPFTPDYVAQRAGIAEADLIEAARVIGEARGGDFGSGVGPSMATRGTLTAYLMRCLQTLRGFWAAEGDEAIRPSVLRRPAAFKAQPKPPGKAWGFGRQMRVRGLQQTTFGMPTAALPEEILTPGEGQIRALFLHGGPMLSFPQQDLAAKAFASLDLLVAHDVEWPLSPSARIADYVVATKKQFEIPAMTQLGELLGLSHPGYGWIEPFAMYQPALFDPPEGSDVLDAWQIYFRLAQRMGLQLTFVPRFAGRATPTPLDMDQEPTTDDLYELMCQNSAIPLARVKQYPNGHVFEEQRTTVGPRDPDCTARLDLANPAMLAELAEVGAEDFAARRQAHAQFPFLFIPRRIQNTTNGIYRPKVLLRTSHNPAYLHSSDLARLGLARGDMVEIRSRHGAIVGFVEADDDLRPGLLSMAHGFGADPGDDYDPKRDGSNVNRLLHWEDDNDPYHGMPRMSAVPVAVTPVADGNWRALAL